MKAKVIKRYRDKNTKRIHKPGEVVDVSKKRFDEINSTKYGVFLEEIIEQKEEKKPSKEKQVIQVLEEIKNYLKVTWNDEDEHI